MEENGCQLGVDKKEDIFSQLESLSEVEEKIRACLGLMQQALSSEFGVDIRTFWNLKKYCLPLFKELNSASIRSQFWQDYIDLTVEARRLKSVIDEETAFVCEQIELAVVALEQDVNIFFADGIKKTDIRERHLAEILEKTKSLQNHKSFYLEIQSKLVWLNVFVSRLVNLRKELMKTDMRVRLKNRFFQRLSIVGNLIFPSRKDYIASVSERFEVDIKDFVSTNFKTNFSTAKVKKNLFFLKSEIKLLQNLAKELTLSTNCFSTTRLSLSECWDELREFEKEVKKERFEDQQISSDNVRLIEEKLISFRQDFLGADIPASQGKAALASISKSMRKLDLVHTDVVALKEQIKALYIILDEREAIEEEQKRGRAREKEIVRQEKCLEFDLLLKSLESKLLEDIEPSQVREELELVKKSLVSFVYFSRAERGEREKLLNVIRNKLLEKEEENLLNLSNEDKNTISMLKEALGRKRIRRKELKEQLEQYKKMTGSSGLDFEQAIYYNGLISEEKSKLDFLDNDILKLEKRISELKAQLF